MAGLISDPNARGELFSAYLDGELTPDELTLVGELLDGDEESVAQFRALRSVRRAVRLVPELEVPAALLPDGHLGDLLSAYLDGELAVFEHRRVTDHLVHCQDCRDDLHELDRARIAVRSLPGADATMTTEIPAIPQPRRRRRFVVSGIAAAAAALVLVVMTTGGGDDPVFTLDDLATRHVARASAEPGFAILPAGLEVSSP
ncbi:MAG: zf-HC2 domain-containing protein [Actinomycetota bacterium]